ncbi:IspD/TarI family cytidylyltransferase, partial [Micrococcus flavus]
MPTALVIAAAGAGTRLGAGVPKALAPLADGRPLLDHCLESVAVARAAGVVLDAVVVLVPPAGADARRVADVVARHEPDLAVPVTCVPGGAERADSVRAGLAAADAALTDAGHAAGSGPRHVLVHDAARAFTPPSVFRAVQDALGDGAPAAVPGLPVTDTIKTVAGPAEQPVVTGTPARSSLRAVQTPQGFDLDLLLAAHEAARASAEADPAALTDDAMAMEAAGHAVRVVPGDEAAFKVTSPRDLGTAAGMLASPERVEATPA